MSRCAQGIMVFWDKANESEQSEEETEASKGASDDDSDYGFGTDSDLDEETVFSRLFKMDRTA